MTRGLVPGLLSSALLLLAPAAAGPRAAEGVLPRVARTGELAAGTRGDARPFAYRTPGGELVGFSVDLLEEIRARLEAEQGRPVALRLREVSPADRVRLVAEGEIDIECSITTATWERERSVDFSIPFLENGTRILATRSRFRNLDDLAGRRIGAIRGSTTLEVVIQALPGAQVVEVADMDEGFALLADGTLDGLANIATVLLSRLEASSGLRDRLVLLPRTGALAWESIGCMVPENDSAWRDLVNRVLADMLVGVADYGGRWFGIYDRWFGPRSGFYYPLDREIARRLAGSAYWLR